MKDVPDRGADPTARLDAELVRRGLARSRGHAQDLIDRGLVRVGTTAKAKASLRVSPTEPIDVADAPRWVGRGAEKLSAALTAYGPLGLTVRGRRALDVGASTGGFTQALLEHGAREVIALDVGHGQLVGELTADPRVVERSGTSIRGLTPEALGGQVEMLVADLSFISLVLVMPELAGLCGPGADAVLLVKPQFEVGRGRLSKKGIVTSRADRVAAVRSVGRAAEAAGFGLRGLIESPTPGSRGNREYLLWLTRDPAVGGSWQALGALIDQAIPEDHV